MLTVIRTITIAASLLPLAVLGAACGGGSDEACAAGNDDAAGSGHGSVGAGSGSVGAGAGAGGGSGSCFQAFPGSWSLQVTAGPNQCNGFEPVEVDVEQQACTVTLSSQHFGGTASVAIDADGKTESAQLPIGDGVVATCYAEFSQSLGSSVGDVFSMTLSCSAMGVTCEFGESKIFTD